MGDELKSRRSDWLDALSEYCALLPAEDVVKCPECGSTNLHLVLGGLIFFWCDVCFNGAVQHTMRMPANVDVPKYSSLAALESVPPFHNVG